MKKIFLTIVAASLIFGFFSPQELNHNSSAGDGFTIQQKQRTGN
ncbi:hypothetical protein [Halalkalibacterium halodurans]|nr:hypothetical protein [Halalkalibacterium halodurans]MDY7220675.1 hypothetical protein [Halalkalibacterium halodurans]MDY7239914.1 hypothetical protein [Halalkalibacterium halodurans]